MNGLWSRFESSRWTHPLLLLTYGPSLLAAPVAAVGMLQASSSREWVMVWFAGATAFSYGIPLACAAIWVARSLRPERVSTRVRRVVTMLAVLGWLPHYLAVACWCLVRGIQRGGFIP